MNRTVTMQATVDAALIGGAVAQVGSYLRLSFNRVATRIRSITRRPLSVTLPESSSVWLPVAWTWF